MSFASQLYLAMVVGGFSLFFVTLMYIWISTRGWAPRDQAVIPTPEAHTFESEAPRLAA